MKIISPGEWFGLPVTSTVLTVGISEKLLKCLRELKPQQTPQPTYSPPLTDLRLWIYWLNWCRNVIHSKLMKKHVAEKHGGRPIFGLLNKLSINNKQIQLQLHYLLVNKINMSKKDLQQKDTQSCKLSATFSRPSTWKTINYLKWFLVEPTDIRSLIHKILLMKQTEICIYMTMRWVGGGSVLIEVCFWAFNKSKQLLLWPLLWATEIMLRQHSQVFKGYNFAI